MRRRANWIVAGLMLAGCAQSPGQTPTPAHPGPDLSKVTHIAGVVYRADASELVVYTSSAALRFKLTPASNKLVWQGKHVAELHPGDNIDMDVHYGGPEQGMEIVSFTAKVMPPSSKPNPHLPHPHGINPQPAKSPTPLPDKI